MYVLPPQIKQAVSFSMAVAADATVVVEGDDQDIIDVPDENEDFDSQPVEKHLLILGETGVGKSYLTNSLFGKALDVKAKASQNVKTRGQEPIMIHTAEIPCKVDERNVCTKFIIYDSRGFADPSCSDTALFKKFAKKIDIDKLDAVLLCHRMGSRFNDSSVRFVELLAKHFLKENEVIWNKCILVLTQANLFGMLEDEDDENRDEAEVILGPAKDEDKDDENGDETKADMCAGVKMLDTMKQWSVAFNDTLIEKGVSKKIYLQIPVCITGSKRNVKFPITKDWIDELLHVTLKKCYNKVREVRAIQLKKKGSIRRRALIGGAIGASVGGTILPVVGLPVGLTIGALVGWQRGKQDAEKQEEKDFEELKSQV